MDLLKNFDTQASYDAIKDSLEYPTVSYVTENDLVYFKERESYFIATYNVTSTTENTTIIGYVSSWGVTYKFNIDQVDKMYIDGVEVEPIYQYKFDTLGEHKVKCTFKKDSLTSCWSMFRGCNLMTKLDLSSLDTSNVTSMQSMFYNCSSLTSLDLSSFDTSKVTYMNEMFQYCYNIKTLNVTHFDTSNVTDMNSMFQNCSGLTSLDLSSLDTSKVTNMSNMFNYCSSLTSLIITSDISKVTSYSDMFRYITTTGTLTYNCDYEDKWNEICVTNQSTSKFPSTWTKTCITV